MHLLARRQAQKPAKTTMQQAMQLAEITGKYEKGMQQAMQYADIAGKQANKSM